MTDDPAAGRHSISTPAELVRGMQWLKDRSGLTYRQIAVRAEEAGDCLPPSTLAGALARQTLPREELLAAFVRACTRDEQAVRSWILARNAVAAQLRRTEARQAPAPDAHRLPPTPRGRANTPSRWRRPLLLLALTTACGTAAWRLVARGDSGLRRTAARFVSSSAVPNDVRTAP